MEEIEVEEEIHQTLIKNENETTQYDQGPLGKVPWKVKLAYVLVSYTLEMGATVWNLFSLHFMTNVALLSPLLVGILDSLYRFWDATNDPFIGRWSDQTQSKRWGRRRGWMFGGAFPYGISFFIMWIVPSSNHWVLFFYYLAIKCIADTSFTSINVTHIALLNDLTSDYDERFKINIFRFACTGLGSLTGVLLAGAASIVFPDEKLRYLVLGGFIATCMTSAILFAVYMTRYYSRYVPSKKEIDLSLWVALKSIFKVRAAALAIGVYSCSIIALQTTLFMVPYYVRDFLGLSNLQNITIILAAQIAGFCVVGILISLTKKVEKRTVYFLGAGLWIAFYLFAPVIHPGGPIWPLYLLAGLLGIGLATSLIVPLSLVTDAADFVEHETHMRQEALLFGVMHMITKYGLGVIVLIFGNVLEASGFDASVKDENGKVILVDSAKLAIQLCMTILPSTLLLIALVMNYLMPITKAKMLEIAGVLRPVPIEPSPNDRVITYFLIDGLDHPTFEKLLKSGKLPNIEKMIEKGSFIKKGVTAFPSMTGYAFYPLITGHDPTQSGILGLRWFNRDSSNGTPGLRNYVGKTNVFMNSDCNSNPKTIFERFPTHHSYSSQCYMNRGCKKPEIRGWGLTTAKYSETVPLFKAIKKVPFIKTSDWFEYENEIMDAAIDDLRLNPKVQWITFASTDTYQHVNGTTPEYEQLVMHIDTLIGKYVEKSIELGQEDNRIYCICSDHGVTNVQTNLDVGSQLKEKVEIEFTYGVGTYVLKTQLDNSFSPYSGKDLVIAINGNACAYLYFRNPKYSGEDQWKNPLSYQQIRNYQTLKRKTVDLIQPLIDIHGIEHVICKGPNDTVEIHSKKGVGSISRQGERYKYRVIEGSDPLIYPSELHDQTLTEKEWLEKSYTSEYPFAVVRTWQVMNSSASVGDFIITSQSGFDVGKDFELFVGNYRGGHGGSRSDQMIVPYILKGPGITEGAVLETGLVEDVGATLMKALGVSDSIQTGTEISQFLVEEEQE